MHIRNELKNQVLITFSDDGERVELVELHPRALYSVDQMVAALARMFRVANWGRIRPLLTYKGVQAVRDFRHID